MSKEIYLEDVRRLRKSGATLIEVLQAKQYDEQHIPGAINIPLKKLDKESVSDLDRTKPTIVYCYDYQ